MMALLPKAMVVDSVPEVSTIALFSWTTFTLITPSFHTAVVDTAANAAWVGAEEKRNVSLLSTRKPLGSRLICCP
jgi:hypothetical protein